MEYIEAKTILRRCTPNRSYRAFEYAMDIYRGCSHGCIYCYARSNYYEKTDNFDCIRAKKDALLIIRDELSRKVKTGIVLTGGVSDCYNPKEKELKLMRNALAFRKNIRSVIRIITAAGHSTVKNCGIPLWKHAKRKV